MATQDALQDRNHIKTLIVESDTTGGEIVRLTAQPTGELNVVVGAGTETIGAVKITDGTETVNITASNEMNVLETNSGAILIY